VSIRVAEHYRSVLRNPSHGETFHNPVREELPTIRELYPAVARIEDFLWNLISRRGEAERRSRDCEDHYDNNAFPLISPSRINSSLTKQLRRELRQILSPHWPHMRAGSLDAHVPYAFLRQPFAQLPIPREGERSQLSHCMVV
jgi:hypothetical protein